MSGEIEKVAVYDSRIVQEKPKYGVQKGGLSVSNSPFKAISASSSQLSFNINVPSQNVFVTREMLWTAGLGLQMTVTVAGSGYVVAAKAATTPQVLSFGKNVAFSPFPLHSCVSTMTATINDTTCTLNTSDVLSELLRMVNQKKNRLQRTTPTMLDKYAVYSQTAGAINNPINNYNVAMDYDNVPNGAFWDMVFTKPDGEVLTGDSPAGTGYVDPLGGFVRWFQGVPVLGSTQANPDDGELKTKYTICVRIRCTEKLILSPFIFSEECADEVGLFGINNMQIVANLKQPSKLLRLINNYPLATDAGASRAISGLTYINSAPWSDPTLNVMFISPSLDLSLPPKSVVQYTEYPRYLTVFNGAFASAATQTFSSNSIVLPMIPDMLIIYAKPSSLGADDYNSPILGDFYLPPSKITVNWNNYSGLLSSHTKEQLYNISVDNGLEMDWNSFNGRAYGSPIGSTQSGPISAIGGFYILRFGKDIPLQASEAPGVVGNYTLQYNIDLSNPFGAAANNITLYTITVNSGYFESQSGSSRIVKGVLTESDVINASSPDADALTRAQLQRMVGGSFWNKLSSALTKAKDVITMPAVRKLLKEGARSSGVPMLKTAADMAEKAGFGMAAGAQTGGASTGGKSRRKGNMSSLM
jgi:hypothetical protein